MYYAIDLPFELRFSLAIFGGSYNKEYKQIRNFEKGDTLHLRMVELAKSFGFENGIPNDIKKLIE